MGKDNSNNDFCLKAISSFCAWNEDEKPLHFYIPSYQRGYRWEPENVEMLLNDIAAFSNPLTDNGDFYCLQPIVVKAKTWTEQNGERINGWEVIDGQQRLTTLYLIMSIFKDNSDYSDVRLFDITYQTRHDMNIENSSIEVNIDSFYINVNKQTILDWKEENKRKVSFDSFRRALFNEENRVVKVIWYENSDESHLESIKTFNDLNRGKISLTSSELIKALFVLYYQGKPEQMEIISEWNHIEKALEDNKLWNFLTNKDYKPSTRIDIVFDFMVNKSSDDDSDTAYKKIQKIYEGKDSLNGKKFGELWDEAKRVFYTFTFWYNHPDRKLYHYIGYLVAQYNVSLHDIYNEIYNMPKDKMEEELRKIIKKRIKLNPEILENIRYDGTYQDRITPVLLLFNIEVSVNMGNYKFDFEEYKTEGKWDIEHIASQTNNKMQKKKDKTIWLNYLCGLTCPEGKDKKSWEKLVSDAKDLNEELKDDLGSKTLQEKFDRIYKEAVESYDDDLFKDEDMKDSLRNLTLLDASTNRGYGNSLFPTKRKFIIEKDERNEFLPPATRNVFLKYYTQDDSKTSQWKNKWSGVDADNYYEAIVKQLKYYLS